MKTRSFLTRGAVIVGTGALLTVMAVSAQAQDAKQLYEKNCVSCHGAGGKGDGPAAKVLKPPPGDLAVTLKAMSDADVAKVIKEGGKAVGKAPTMPAYGAKMNDDQIKGVVGYIKAFGSK